MERGWKQKCRTYRFIVESKTRLTVAGKFRMSIPITPEEAALEAIDEATETAKHLNHAFDKDNLHVVVIPVFR
jgi:hypothetical protein